MKLTGNLASLLLLVSSIFAQSSETDRLLKLGEDIAPQWYTNNQVYELIKNKVRFIDVTDREIMARSATPIIPYTYKIPKKTRFHTKVNSAIKHLSAERAKQFVTKMASWNNRFYNTTDGIAASSWIHQQASTVARKYGKKASTSLFRHKFPQSSIIARIQGSVYPDQIVVLGGHMDSVNYTDPVYGRAPGAEDNASGSSAIMEAFRALTTIGFKPKRTLEFHWYAGEEMGLLGSADIAQTYYKEGKKVVSMVQLDMVGHLDKKIQITNDFTDNDLNQFVKRLVESYTDVEWVDGKCGYACSDHASWTEFGYRATIPAEDVYQEELIHTENDTIDIVNFNRWLTFAKIVTGYLIEIGEPAN